MARLRPANTLTRLDAAYIAGLIDGEGTVALTRHAKDEQRTASLSIANNDRVLLEWVRWTVGVGSISTKRPRAETHHTAYAWAVSHAQAISVLRQVVRFLRTYKKQRALIVLAVAAITPRNGRYTPDIQATRSWLEEVFLKVRP